jgi:hypothetical protein
MRALPATPYDDNDNGKIKLTLANDPEQYMSMFNFMMQYPCDAKIEQEFINLIDSYVSQIKIHLMKIYAANMVNYMDARYSISLSYYSHVYKCHLSRHTCFMYPYDKYYSCQIDTSKSGKCYSIKTLSNQELTDTKYVHDYIFIDDNGSYNIFVNIIN